MLWSGSPSYDVLLPADSEYSVIMANYKGGSDSWGGQYDANTQTIQFATSYSGEYSVLRTQSI